MSDTANAVEHGNCGTVLILVNHSIQDLEKADEEGLALVRCDLDYLRVCVERRFLDFLVRVRDVLHQLLVVRVKHDYSLRIRFLGCADPL